MQKSISLCIATILLISAFSYTQSAYSTSHEPPSEMDNAVALVQELHQNIDDLNDQNKKLPRDVRNVLDSFDANGIDSSMIVVECPANDPVSKIIFNVSVDVGAFSPGKTNGIDMAAHASMTSISQPVITKDPEDENKNVKEIDINYEIAIDPGFVQTNKNKGNLFEVVTQSALYHEMLHVQLAIDEIKSKKWDGIDELCKCNTYKNTKNIKPGDPQHGSILPLEHMYIQLIAEINHFTYTTSNAIVLADYAGNFKNAEIPIPPPISDKGRDITKLQIGSNTKNVVITTAPYNGIYPALSVSGSLLDPSVSGHVTFIIDPPSALWIHDITITPSDNQNLMAMHAGGTSIPIWVKSNAGWWADGSIDDNSFINGIEYMINKGIIQISKSEIESQSSEEISTNLEIPQWVKSNAGWWADGSIDDNSFINGIHYLIKNNLIKSKILN